MLFGADKRQSHKTSRSYNKGSLVAGTTVSLLGYSFSSLLNLATAKRADKLYEIAPIPFIHLVLFLNFITIILVVSGDTKCPVGFTKSGVFCFLVAPPRTFAEQDTYCTSLGGYLAKIGSSEENSAIIDYLNLTDPGS